MKDTKISIIPSIKNRRNKIKSLHITKPKTKQQKKTRSKNKSTHFKNPPDPPLFRSRKSERRLCRWLIKTVRFPKFLRTRKIQLIQSPQRTRPRHYGTIARWIAQRATRLANIFIAFDMSDVCRYWLKGRPFSVGWRDFFSGGLLVSFRRCVFSERVLIECCLGEVWMCWWRCFVWKCFVFDSALFSVCDGTVRVSFECLCVWLLLENVFALFLLIFYKGFFTFSCIQSDFVHLTVSIYI